jgi:D-amino peptidase
VKKGFILSVIACLSLFLIAANMSFGQEKLKVFISVDMEGIAGVVNGDQTSSSGNDYGIARRWMTAEVNDSHGSMRNVIIALVALAQ